MMALLNLNLAYKNWMKMIRIQFDKITCTLKHTKAMAIYSGNMMKKYCIFALEINGSL